MREHERIESVLTTGTEINRNKYAACYPSGGGRKEKEKPIFGLNLLLQVQLRTVGRRGRKRGTIGRKQVGLTSKKA